LRHPRGRRLATHARLAQEDAPAPAAQGDAAARKRKPEAAADAADGDRSASLLARYKVARAPGAETAAPGGTKPTFGYGLAPQPVAATRAAGAPGEAGASAGEDEDGGDYYEGQDEDGDADEDAEEGAAADLAGLADETIQESDEVRCGVRRAARGLWPTTSIIIVAGLTSAARSFNLC
jgi:hypothetical protein